mgnify:CR=1 FL=1
MSLAKFQRAINRCDYRVMSNMLREELVRDIPHMYMSDRCIQFLSIMCGVQFSPRLMQWAITSDHALMVICLHKHGCPWPRVRPEFVTLGMTKLLMMYGVQFTTSKSVMERFGLVPAESWEVCKLYHKTHRALLPNGFQYNTLVL